MLFKLVVITVLVIAESADTCIKTVGFFGKWTFFLFPISCNMAVVTSIDQMFITLQMLRNCRVARVLPRIMDSAKNDRNSVLRARS